MSLSLESTPTPALLPASVSAPADYATALPYHRPGAPPAEPLPSELLQHAMRYISVAKDAVADASIIASIGRSGSRLTAFALTTSSAGTLLVGAPPAGPCRVSGCSRIIVSVEQCSQLLPHTSFRRPRLADRAQEVHMPIAAGSSSVNAVAAPHPCIRHPLLPHLMPAVSTPSRALAKTKRYLIERWTSTLSPTSGTSARSSIAQNAPPFTAVPKQLYAPEKGWIHAFKSGLLQPLPERVSSRIVQIRLSAQGPSKGVVA